MLVQLDWTDLKMLCPWKILCMDSCELVPLVKLNCDDFGLVVAGNLSKLSSVLHFNSLCDFCASFNKKRSTEHRFCNTFCTNSSN